MNLPKNNPQTSEEAVAVLNKAWLDGIIGEMWKQAYTFKTKESWLDDKAILGKVLEHWAIDDSIPVLMRPFVQDAKIQFESDFRKLWIC